MELMNESITNLICEYFDAKYEKAISIKKQDYESAAKLRDKERITSAKLSEYFGDSEYKRESFNLSLSNYCMEHFGFDPKDSLGEDLKQRIREIKLKRIGL